MRRDEYARISSRRFILRCPSNAINEGYWTCIYRQDAVLHSWLLLIFQVREFESEKFLSFYPLEENPFHSNSILVLHYIFPVTSLDNYIIVKMKAISHNMQFSSLHFPLNILFFLYFLPQSFSFPFSMKEIQHHYYFHCIFPAIYLDIPSHYKLLCFLSLILYAISRRMPWTGEWSYTMNM